MTLPLLHSAHDPVLIDNSPEREFDDIQPGEPDERREVEAEQEEEARRPPADAERARRPVR
jgi:hypothetical protein